MSYRTKVNGVQIFGNNEYYEEWIEFLKSQDVEIDEEGCYEGEITDFMGALVCIEKITLKLAEERAQKNELLQKRGYNGTFVNLRGLFDFTNIQEDLKAQEKDEGYNKYNMSLFDRLSEIINNGYTFMPYKLYLACEDRLERMESFSEDGHLNCFKVKDGETIKVEAS